MSLIGRRVFFKVTRCSAHSGGFCRIILLPCTVRTLSVSSNCCARTRRPTGDDEQLSQPIKFTTSKASHRTWKVERSFGITHQRPWWRVLPLSLLGISFLLWCIFRKVSDVDHALDKELYDHLPELLTVMEVQEDDEAGTSTKAPEDGVK